ncbi:hypothetical protein [Kitasatospora sp. GP82]|uniref:hypothetical protein n=1 Tax=Kitasatospora sp. GP82 TaxID=3035089 RepID=UPI0024769F70|nr:hypothetical protein [Kitasatospora sp. GP82]MDH6129959.1 hypothetical protein [Kitasatospora sp. GP82]
MLPAGVDDDIVAGRIIHALKTIRDARGYSIPQALDVFADRYELLRRTRPNDFTLSPEEYGRGFHS